MVRHQKHIVRYQQTSWTPKAIAQHQKSHRRKPINNIDKLKVTLRNPQDNFEAECSAFGKSDSGELRLVNGRKEITCNIDTTDLQEVSYQDLLIIDLKYMYRDHVRTSLTVQNALT